MFDKSPAIRDQSDDGRNNKFGSSENQGASMLRNNRFKLALLLCTGIGAPWAQQAAAQTSPTPLANEDSAGPGGNDIVITARSRSETLKNVPDTVNAFSATQIENAQVKSFTDLARLAPSLVLTDKQQGPGVQFISLRGIAQQANQEPPVAVVIDGVQTTSPSAISQGLFDVEQIEVLKGPQGALYGRNAEAGAIIINTRQPTNAFEARITGGLGTDGYRNVEGVISGPVIQDKMLLRVAANTLNWNGAWTSAAGFKFTGRHDRNLRVQDVIMPTDNLKIDLRYHYSHTTNNGWAPYILSNDDTSNFNIKQTSPHGGDNYRHINEGSAKISYDLGKIGVITSTTGWLKSLDHSNYDLDATPVAVADFPVNNFAIRTISEDVRIVSPSSKRLRYTLGAYYLDQRTDRLQTFEFYPAYFVAAGAAAIPTAPVFSTTSVRIQQKAWALYGQLNYDLAQGLELTLAGRYDSDDVTQLNRLSGQQFNTTFSKFQPKASIRYALSPDLNLYASYAQGFRDGGFNTNPLFPAIYSPETTRAFEAGFKSELFDRRVTFNTALFYTIYKNQQITIPAIVPGGGQGVLGIPKDIMKGIETSLAVKVTRELALSGQLSYMDAKISSFDTRPTLVGNRPPYAPRWNYSVAADYKMALSSDNTLLAHADVAGQEGMYTEFYNLLKQQPYAVVNGRIQLNLRDVSLAIFSKNLFNEKYYVDLQSRLVTGAFKSNFAVRGEGRLIGAEVTIRFH
jgi:iron complex outermembrane receptor protein